MPAIVGDQASAQGRVRRALIVGQDGCVNAVAALIGLLAVVLEHVTARHLGDIRCVEIHLGDVSACRERGAAALV